MTKPDRLPKTISQTSARALLEADGWTCVRGGKHVIKMTKPGERPITLPHHRGAVYGPGLKSDILRAAGFKGPLSEDEVASEDQQERSGSESRGQTARENS